MTSNGPLPRTPFARSESPSQVQAKHQCLESLIKQNMNQIYEHQIQIQSLEEFMVGSKMQTQPSNGHNQSTPEELQAYIDKWRAQLYDMHTKAGSMVKALLNHEIPEAIRHAAESKEHLLNVDLQQWKIKQKRAQFSSKAKQEALLQELDRLDPIFEQCGEEMKKIYELIDQVESILRSINIGACETLQQNQLIAVRNSINSLISCFVWESFVVATQPAPVLMKSRAPLNADAIRRAVVRPLCQPVIRLLGGATLGCRVVKDAVTCNIINEDQAKQIYAEKTTVTPVGKLLGFTAHFETDSQNRYFAKFSRITLVNIKRPSGGTEGIPRQRYYLLFTFTLNVRGRDIAVGKLSLPVAALVHPRQEYEQGADAFIFWDLAFSEGVGIPNAPRENCDGVPWPLAAEALNLKFQQLIEGPRDESNTKQELTQIAIRHLASKFFGEMQDYSKCLLTWEMFFKQDTCPALKKENGQSCTFREWFYKCAEIINRKLFRFWNSGLILGFASKSVSEALLLQQEQPNMMMRFSDSQLGCLIISYVIPGSGLEPQHLRVGGLELESVSLDNCIRYCEELRNVQLIYPNHAKSELWSKEEVTAPSSNPPYGRRMFISLNVEPLPVMEYEAPTPPLNLNMDKFDDWFSEQYFDPNQPMEPIELENITLYNDCYLMDI